MRPVSSRRRLAILPAVPLAAQVVPALDRAEMDTTVHPGDNFYQFVNGGWLAAPRYPPTGAATAPSTWPTSGCSRDSGRW